MKNQHNNDGFTLIEVMLVLLIMSMLAGAVSIGISQRNSLEFSSELNRIHRMLLQANDRALMRQELVGFFIIEDSSGIQYEFKKIDIETLEWKAFRLAHWKPHDLPLGINLDVEISDQFGSASDSALNEASLIFTPDGQYTPFELNLESQRRGIRKISGDGFAPIVINTNDEV